MALYWAWHPPGEWTPSTLRQAHGRWILWFPFHVVLKTPQVPAAVQSEGLVTRTGDSLSRLCGLGMLNHIIKAGWLRPSGFCGIIFNAPAKKIVNQPYYWQFPITVVGRADDLKDYLGAGKSPGPWQSRLQKNKICLLLIIDGMPSGLLVSNMCTTFYFFF